MAAPTTTARPTPTGYKLPDGFRTMFAFNFAPSVGLWVTSIKTPGFDGGEEINTSTFHNAEVMTKAAQHLLEVTNLTMKCAVDPDNWNTLFTMVNREGSGTLHYPDHSKTDFYCFLKKYEPEDWEKGKFPMASVEVVFTNWDPVNFVEVKPVHTPSTGTG